MRICTIEGCQDRLYAVGLCNKHYLRKKIHGDPNHVEVIKFDTETRFWSKVEKTDGCWNWKGFLRTGYGCMSIKGKQIPAHRYAYELLVGKIPEGKHIDHLCRNRACVNPVHLEPVTLRENVLRGEGLTAKNADKTHCPNGHEYDRKYWNNRDKSYQRACSTCSRAKDSKQRYQEKKKLKIQIFIQTYQIKTKPIALMGIY